MAEYVSVPVPTDRLQEVYELLAARPATNTAAPLPDGWDQNGIRLFYIESSPNARKFLEYLAARPGVEVSAAEFGQHLGLDSRALGGMLSSLYRRSANRYKREWPLIRYERGDQEVSYMMSQQVAAHILDSARDASDAGF